MKRLPLFAAALFGLAPLAARPPLYIVDGEPRDEIASIAASDIETIEELPADEESIARYGERASDGVILITLKYDAPARFGEGASFADHIAARIEWADDDPVARVVLRYRVTPEGRAVVTEVLESTDGRLKRRVLKAVAAAPCWSPARKNGTPVETEHILRIQLPAGRRMPGEPYIRIR
ncbi:MAG: TonB-dependent receptor [Alistipes sp.]|nr:TonB-dependent receptor [Alistipes sp.]